MTSYSSRAAKALGYLKRFYNDIDIYVEDTSNNNMWLHIIENVLPNSVKITSVNVLGGRQNVLAACKNDQADDGRRKLYIIDADFDFLLGIPKKRLKHLYRIRAYCIENIILHPKNVIEAGFNN